MAFQQNSHLLNYVIEGDGPPVVLLHGISASIRHWQWLIHDLTEAGFRALAVDLLGHGDSAKPKDPGLYTIRAVYATFEHWLDSQQIKPPYNLVGHSLGGYLSLWYALRHPVEVRNMVLIDPLYSLKQLTPFLRYTMPLDFFGAKLIQATPRWVVNTFLSLNEEFTTDLAPEVRQMYAQDIKRASPSFLTIPNSAVDFTPYLKLIPAKTLVIYGINDHLEYPASFPRLVSGLPNAIGKAISGCGHQPHHHRPDFINPMILDFLNHSSNESTAKKGKSNHDN